MRVTFGLYPFWQAGRREGSLAFLFPPLTAPRMRGFFSRYRAPRVKCRPVFNLRKLCLRWTQCRFNLESLANAEGNGQPFNAFGNEIRPGK